MFSIGGSNTSVLELVAKEFVKVVVKAREFGYDFWPS